MAYFRTCPICGAHLDPGEACDCVTVYTGYPGETFVSMGIEAGKIGHCAIYIGQNEPDPGAAYRRALGYLEERIKEALPQRLDSKTGESL